MKKSIAILLLIGALFTCTAYSQQSNSTETNQELLKKNAFYANVGTTFLYSDVNFAYERNIFHQNYSYYNIQVSYGILDPRLSQKLQQFTICPSWLFGKAEHHMELNLGVTASFDYITYRDPRPASSVLIDYVYFSPAAYLGYRYQKPGGEFLFRVGIGFPEQIGIGLGWCF